MDLNSNRLLILIIYLFLFFEGGYNAVAQEYHINGNTGIDTNDGSIEKPFKSLDHAIDYVNKLTGTGDITLVVHSGIYTLTDKLVINPVRIMNDTTYFTLRASILPDEEGWSPQKMPVIQSVSGNNSNTQFAHATGILVSSKNVNIQGIKFLGNNNPDVEYYYPISKEDPSLANLSVSQCMFIGDKESAKIQGGIWAHGPNNRVDHSIFFECRNAVLFFQNVEGFEITNSIIADSYESAFWFTGEDVSFEFTNNLLLNNECLVVAGGTNSPNYSSRIKDSALFNNKGILGVWSREKSKVLLVHNDGLKMENSQYLTSAELHLNLNVNFEKMHLHPRKLKVSQSVQPGLFEKN